MKYMPELVSHRKAAIALWILVMLILVTALVVTVWAHIFKPDFFPAILFVDFFFGVIAFCLLLLSLALNNWTPILKK
jgi:hypothetical protein